MKCTYIVDVSRDVTVVPTVIRDLFFFVTGCYYTAVITLSQDTDVDPPSGWYE